MAGDVLEDQVEDTLDVWYGFVGSTPHLVCYFTGPDGRLLGDYLAAVRRRFGQWILDTCRRPYDQVWLDYQHEIGLRHHRSKKNRTDGVQSVEHMSLRYVVALIASIALTIKPFLAKKGHSAEEVDKDARGLGEGGGAAGRPLELPLRQPRRLVGAGPYTPLGPAPGTSPGAGRPGVSRAPFGKVGAFPLTKRPRLTNYYGEQ